MAASGVVGSSPYESTKSKPIRNTPTTASSRPGSKRRTRPAALLDLRIPGR